MLGRCEWDQVPTYAEQMTRKFLSVIFPNYDMSKLLYTEIISHYVVDNSILSRVSPITISISRWAVEARLLQDFSM